jgi:hypothetical protein
MSTVTTKPDRPILRPRKPWTEDEMRRDRRTGILVLVVVLAIMAALVWLASLGGNGVQGGIEYWPLMP